MYVSSAICSVVLILIVFIAVAEKCTVSSFSASCRVAILPGSRLSICRARLCAAALFFTFIEQTVMNFADDCVFVFFFRRCYRALSLFLLSLSLSLSVCVCVCVPPLFISVLFTVFAKRGVQFLSKRSCQSRLNSIYVCLGRCYPICGRLCSTGKPYSFPCRRRIDSLQFTARFQGYTM